MAYYVLDANKNLKEGLDKEGIYAMLEQAIENGDLEHVDEDSAFVSKLKEVNSGANFKVWIGTTAEYNAIQTKTENTLYLLTDDNLDQQLTTMEQDMATLQENVDSLSEGLTTATNTLNQRITSETNTLDQKITTEINRVNNILASEEIQADGTAAVNTKLAQYIATKKYLHIFIHFKNSYGLPASIEGVPRIGTTTISGYPQIGFMCYIENIQSATLTYIDARNTNYVDSFEVVYFKDLTTPQP